MEKTEYHPLQQIKSNVVTGYPKPANKRLLYLFRSQHQQYCFILPLLNINEIRNVRKEIFEIKNEQRFLLSFDDSKYIRFYQSYSLAAPEESLRNFIEVYNIVGQKL